MKRHSPAYRADSVLDSKRKKVKKRARKHGVREPGQTRAFTPAQLTKMSKEASCPELGADLQFEWVLFTGNLPYLDWFLYTRSGKGIGPWLTVYIFQYPNRCNQVDFPPTEGCLITTESYQRPNRGGYSEADFSYRCTANGP